MPRIQEMTLKIKGWLDVGFGEWGLFALVFLVGLASFGLGRLSVLDVSRPPVAIQEAPSEAKPGGMYIGAAIVASRTGKAYYYPWCTGVAKIAPQNQVFFLSESAARAAGYAPAKACKGLVN